MAISSRYLVGIDLGTTHTVVAYADTLAQAGDAKDATPKIQSFAVEQLVAPGEVGEKSVLPSALFHPVDGALEGNVLPWGRTRLKDEPQHNVVGTLANSLGAKSPGRLVSSAKSWLSNNAVDRTANILPWGAGSDVPKISPVQASANYLAHLRSAWDVKFPKNPLSTQEVILTVPASFDEGARALTLDAAKRAGLRVRLVEEPQAAFYRWLDANRDELEDALKQSRLVIVVDVGGGTTDLTLLKVELRESGPRLTRIAVGEHLMLGGDNMDLALAKTAEAALGSGKKLSTARFAQLVLQCRAAKERLLAADAPEKATLTILGTGSKLIGASQKAEVSREQVRALALDGFFPEVPLESVVEKRRAGIVEFGLPYVSDAAVTRHVASFLKRHETLAREALSTKDERDSLHFSGPAVPDAVLFNGGVFRSDALQKRMCSVLSDWRGSPVRVLENAEPDLAVAQGAVAYGLARRGMGLRIGGGSARSYFLLVDKGRGDDGEGEGQQTGVCVLPRGAEEAEEVLLKERIFSLRLGRPVRFHLVSSTADVRHVAAGDLVNIDDPERYTHLPPVAAVLDAGDEDAPSELPVRLATALTEIGTLEMNCIEALEPGAAKQARRWKLEQQLRGAGDKALAAQKVSQLHPRFAEATALIKAIYGKSKGQKEVKASAVKRLRADLEKVLGPRQRWDTPLLRELFGALLAGLKRRRRSADHERMWFHLVGYSLRPGFGYPLDEWRVAQLAPVLKQGLQFAPESQNWSEYWTMWRRLAGGLSDKEQRSLMEKIGFYMQPPSKKPRKRPSGPKMLGTEAMIRLVGALERIDVDKKAQVGGWLVQRLNQHDENPQSWWAVGRIGARVPFYGSAHLVVPPNVVSQWIEVALTFDFSDAPEAAFAATLMARRSGDRQRDLPEELRIKVAERLEAAELSPSWRNMVLEVQQLDEADERRIFGDSMPPGLRLID